MLYISTVFIIKEALAQVISSYRWPGWEWLSWAVWNTRWYRSSRWWWRTWIGRYSWSSGQQWITRFGWWAWSTWFVGVDWRGWWWSRHFLHKASVSGHNRHSHMRHHYQSTFVSWHSLHSHKRLHYQSIFVISNVHLMKHINCKCFVYCMAVKFKHINHDGFLILFSPQCKQKKNYFTKNDKWSLY